MTKPILKTPRNHSKLGPNPSKNHKQYQTQLILITQSKRKWKSKQQVAVPEMEHEVPPHMEPNDAWNYEVNEIEELGRQIEVPTTLV